MISKALRTLVPDRYRRSTRFEQLVRGVSAGRVLAGPFQGMRYLDRLHGGVLLPKLLGTYERELHPVVEALVSDPPERVIVAGTAEGYYAVGFARLPGVREVIGFEASAAARADLLALAKLNECEAKLTIHGICTCSALARLLADGRRTLLVVDIEGGEAVPLDPQVVPGLADCRMLIEVHDGFIEGLAAELTRRFERTHDVLRIENAARTIDDVPSRVRSRLPAAWSGAALHGIAEWRGNGTPWLLFTPRSMSVYCGMYDPGRATNTCASGA